MNRFAIFSGKPPPITHDIRSPTPLKQVLVVHYSEGVRYFPGESLQKLSVSGNPSAAGLSLAGGHADLEADELAAGSL